MKGTTLAPNEGLLTVKQNSYVLPKTPIGLMTPLRFPIELSNVGSIKINYKTEVQYEEGEFKEVFKIENPSNFMLSGENSYLYCLYKPLIKKKYEFKININVFDFSKLIQKVELSFSGSADEPINQENPLSQAIPCQRTSVS